MHLFIGLTFHQNYLQFKKIDSFRRRFDEKYNRSHILQMTLMPPFRLENFTFQGINELTEEMADDLEGHFVGMEPPLHVDFNGFDFQAGKKGILFLKPTIPVDLFHCQEGLKEAIKSHGGVFNKHKNLGKSFANDLQTFLPIGRFNDMDLLGQAVEKARIEFAQPFKLSARDITIFEKTPAQWIPRRILYTFPKVNQWEQAEEGNFSIIKTPANL